MSDAWWMYIVIFVFGLGIGHAWGEYAERRAEERKHIDKIVEDITHWTNTNG